MSTVASTEYMQYGESFLTTHLISDQWNVINIHRELNILDIGIILPYSF